MKVKDERTITLKMTIEEAKVLKCLAPNIGYEQIIDIGASLSMAAAGAKLFESITAAFRGIGV